MFGESREAEQTISEENELKLRRSGEITESNQSQQETQQARVLFSGFQVITPEREQL